MNNFYRRNLPKLVWFVCALAFWSQSIAAQEAVKIWEFSPYEVEVWCALDPNLDVSDLAKSQFVKTLSDDLDRMFQAAWHTKVKSAETDLRSRLARDIQTLTLEDFSREELVLLVNRDAASTVKTAETAAEKISEFAILPQHKAKVDAEAAKATIDPNSAVGGLISKLKTIEGDMAAIMAGLEAKTIQAALVPRSAAKGTEKIARTITVLLPWQTDSLLRQHDKLFLVHVGQATDGYYVQARELDCTLQFMGPTIRREATSWSFVSRTAAAAIASAFAPIARVESAASKSANLRLKAGGLIMDDGNPAKVHLGDLMQPVVRREGSSGMPSMLEAIPWTYAAIIESDGVKMKANVYAYSGGPGLQGRNNRRTQRLLLRVRPTEPETEIQVSVKSSGRPQGGCAVYERDLITDKFTLLGKTDWRGRFVVPAPSKTGAVLPDAIHAAKAAAEKAAKEAIAAAAASAAAATTPTEKDESEGEEADEAEAAPKPAAAPAPTTPAPAPAPVDYEKHLVQLRQPLVQLYVKSGDVVLARLPLVPGISPLEVAELADDSRRLEAEAFIRGFQGEVLDLIGLRTLLSTRVRKLLEQGKKAEAEKVMAELRGLKDYSAMVETLDKLQRKLLDDSLGPVSMGAKARIDKMLQTTREMMQKYLQNDLVRDAETAVSRGSVPQEEVSVPDDKSAASSAPNAATGTQP
ncbi:MAG: hypothetical protein SFV81_27725 [Pirellulaceae bacterium]|nr:hypothetical protein [Pirellulaceae bacterium]